MKFRIVKLIRPYGSKDNNLICVSVLKIHFTKKNMTIYDTVDLFKKENYLKIKTTKKQVTDIVQLREIVNLHNSTGIKNISQIISMVKQIRTGKDILSPKGLPNIKLVKTEQSEWILFDGHHSLLAYIIAGKKHLNDLPHLVIENENGYVADKEICVFFGIHSKKIKHYDWRKYVINWQAAKDKQLCKRVQRNIGELLDSISFFHNKNKNFNNTDEYNTYFKIKKFWRFEMSEISKDYTTDEILTVLMSREVRNDDVMIVGVATPMVWAAFTLAKLTHAPDAIYHYIMGNTFVLEPRQVSLLYLEMNINSAYKFQNSGECTLESLPSDRLTTIEFFRPAQIDQYGNTNNICIGDYHKPKIRLPGCAGIADFSMFYSRGQFLYTPRHDTRTFVPSENIFFISGVGFQNGKPSICGGAGPQCMITNLAYLTFDDETKRMTVGTVHPGVDIEDLKKSTGFELLVPKNLKETIPPTFNEIKLLREKVDPLGIRKLEVLAGKERLVLLNEIIGDELAMKKKFPQLLTLE